MVQSSINANSSTRARAKGYWKTSNERYRSSYYNCHDSRWSENETRNYDYSYQAETVGNKSQWSTGWNRTTGSTDDDRGFISLHSNLHKSNDSMAQVGYGNYKKDQYAGSSRECRLLVEAPTKNDSANGLSKIPTSERTLVTEVSPSLRISASIMISQPTDDVFWLVPYCEDSQGELEQWTMV